MGNSARNPERTSDKRPHVFFINSLFAKQLAFVEPPPPPRAPPRRKQNKRWIDEAFGSAASSVEETVRRLEGMVAPSADPSGREWAQGALESLAKASPTALKVCFVLSFPGGRQDRPFFLFFSASLRAERCPPGERERNF